MGQYLVFDIGGTLIKYALMAEDGALLCQGKAPSPTESEEALFAALAAAGAQFAGQFSGVAVSMPGRIDTATGVAHTGGAFFFIRDLPVGPRLAALFGVPVTVANDGKCAANAEAWTGALAGTPDGAVLTLGTGIGGGIVLGGRVWMGSTFAAGELSFFPTDLARIQEGTGDLRTRKGAVWANRVSARALLSDYAARKGLPESGHGLDGFAFFRAYEQGDPDAAAALEQMAAFAAAGIFSLQAVLDLQRYAIGGGISARPEVAGSIRRAVDALYARHPRAPFCKPEIVACRYGNEANLLGALRFHRDACG